MSDLDLDAIEARVHEVSQIRYHSDRTADSTLMYKDAPALIAEVRRLRSARVASAAGAVLGEVLDAAGRDLLDRAQDRAESAEAETSRLRDGADDTPREPNAWPTPAQAWSELLAMTTERRLEMLDGMVDGMRRSAQCFTADHEHRIEHLEAEVRALRAKVERVEALALGWQEHGLPGMTNWDFGQDVRDALRGDGS